MQNTIVHCNYGMRLTAPRVVFLTTLASLSIGASQSNGSVEGPVPQSQAYQEIVVETILGSQLDGQRVSAADAPVPSGTSLRTWKEALTVLESDSWVFFVDHQPDANWEHSATVVAVGVQTGEWAMWSVRSPLVGVTGMRELTEAPEQTSTYRSPLGHVERASHGERDRPDLYAVLINGGFDSSNNHVRYWNDLSFMYEVLVSEGYSDDRIHVLCSDGTDPGADRSDGTSSPLDLDGDGDDDIDFAATTANLQQVFDGLSSSMDAGDMLFVFTTDHGGQGASAGDSVLYLWGESISDADFATMVDLVPSTCDIVVAMEQCYSGGFVDDLEGPGRVIITAADHDEVSWSADTEGDYDEFSYHFTSALAGHDPTGTTVDADDNGDGHVSFREAFLYAEGQDSRQETPQYSSDPTQLGDRLALTGRLTIPIAEGLDWLRERQAADGSWYNDPAVTSFAVLSMLNAAYDESDPDVAAGLAYVLARINPDGSVHDNPNRYTYYTSIAILPLVASHNPDYHDEIASMRDWLIGSQWDEDSFYGSVDPSHPYYGGFGYGNHTRPDLSNTQWALMGLKAADRELGLVAADTYDKTLTFLGRCQNPDGGSGYTPGHGYGSVHTMTAASVWSYSLCGIPASDSRVADGVQWLADRYSLTNPDGWGYWSEYYYKVTLAKALVMTHRTTLAGHDWFAELAALLIDERLGDGQWPDTGMMGEELSTCWAIMTLQTRTLPPGADLSMSIILASHADVHVYDPQGRHVGMDYDTMTVDLEIPGAALRLLTENGEEVPFEYPIPEDLRQVVDLPQLVSGSYRIELIGTSDGPFELTVNGLQDGEVVTTGTFEGEITTGQHLGTHVTVTAMEGALTFLYETLSSLPTLEVDPDELTVLGSPDTVAEATFTVREAGGLETLHSVGVYATDLVGPNDTIPGSEVTFDMNDFDVAPGAEQVVTAFIAIPAEFSPPYVGLIVVESLDGGTRSIDLTVRGLPEGVIAVDADASGANDGSSWADAYTDLQSALAHAATDDPVAEIWVAEGTYTPAMPGGDRHATFQLLNGIGIYGGFAGWETERDQRDIDVNLTILSGDLAGNDGPDFDGNEENAYHVATGSGCDESAILDGFTITGGNANQNYPRNCGGGMFNVEGSPTVAHCRFVANVAYDGAGMHNRDFSSPVVYDCTFADNLAGKGGGISNLNHSRPEVTGCVFEDNTARCWDGGAILCINYCRPVVQDCRFAGNAANYYGGVIANFHWSSPKMMNCLACNNLAGVAGGGMFCFNGSQAAMINCTLHGNTADDGAALAFDSDTSRAADGSRSGDVWIDHLGKLMRADDGIVLRCGHDDALPAAPDGASYEPSSVELANCILWDGGDEVWNHDGSTVWIEYSNVYGGWPDGDGNIDADPVFVDAPAGDLHIEAGSPCIDAGMNGAIPLGVTTDLDGNPRRVDDPATDDTGLGSPPIVDMGAYEFQEPEESDSGGFSAESPGRSTQPTARSSRPASPPKSN